MEISKRLELLDIVAESQGDSLSVRYIRDGEEKVCSITPEKREWRLSAGRVGEG